MPDKKISLGLIGLGGVAQANFAGYECIDTFNIISVCDVRDEAADEVARRYDANAYTDYRELLKAGNIDLVLVLTPVSSHREIVEAAANTGFHVFCEKPLAVTLADAQAMVAACRQANVKLFYGSSYRYLPAVKKAKQLIDAGAIGDIQLMTEQVIGGRGIDNYYELPAIHYPHGGPGGGGMSIMDHGIHLIDVFSWFTEADIIKVQGKGLISGEGPGSEYMVMTFANGAIAHLIYNVATYTSVLPNEGMYSGGQGYFTDGSIAKVGVWHEEPGSISIYGTHGTLRIFHYTNALYINTGQGPHCVELTGRPAFGHFATQLEDCASAIFNDRPPSIGGEDGIRALAAALAVYDSHNNSRQEGKYS